MNREIKFRCFFYDGLDYKTGSMISFNEAMSENYVDWDDAELKPIDACTILMQYTGLKDKNGKEIYEGDILLTQEAKDNYPLKHTIVFNVDQSAFRMRWVGSDSDSFYDQLIYQTRFNVFEVIGNIYENPELLEH
jgi:uncharacterized phage protein (TIGR01671 family)